MKKKSVYLSVLLATMLVNAPEAFSQGKTKEKQVQKSDSTVIVNTKEEKKSNVMLSAESSSSPRQLNIGLPFAGDILILENDLPVVYSFWTQMPMTTWRYDNSIGRIGLMSFAEGALTFGKVGYCVTSWDRDPSPKFKGFASVYTSNYGSLKYDATVTGPIGKKGWGYMLGFNETYDRGSGTNYQFTPWGDRAEFFKAALMKKYNQGKIKLTYKYATSKTIYGAYAPLVYEGNGKTSSVDGFKLGSDSYILGSGKFPYYDYNTGASKWADLNSDSASRTLSHTIYLNGEHRFKNNMKLTYSSMYMKSKAAFTIQYPISLGVTDVDQQATTGSTAYYHGSTNPYNGPVQMIAAQYYPQVDINTSLSRIELTKKVGANDLRGGFTYQYYDAPEMSYGGIYYQTVEKNPQPPANTHFCRSHCQTTLAEGMAGPHQATAHRLMQGSIQCWSICDQTCLIDFTQKIHQVSCFLQIHRHCRGNIFDQTNCGDQQRGRDGMAQPIYSQVFIVERILA